jgi:hypothetical protein
VAATVKDDEGRKTKDGGRKTNDFVVVVAIIDGRGVVVGRR